MSVLTTQFQIDTEPRKEDATITVQGGDAYNLLVIESEAPLKVRIMPNSFVKLYGNIKATSLGDNWVEAYDNCNIVAGERDYIICKNNSKADFRDSKGCSCEARDTSCIYTNKHVGLKYTKDRTVNIFN